MLNPFATFVGGSKFGLVQFEFGMPIGKTATIAAFFDAGGVYDTGEDWGADGLRVSAGVEFRVFLPVFRAPIRLIYGWPLREVSFVDIDPLTGFERNLSDRTTNFQFAIGLPF